MITIEVPVECSSARHRVVLRIDGLGRTRFVLEDHNEVAEMVLESLGGAPSACEAARRGPARLRSAVSSAIERARWVNVGVRDLDDLDAWYTAGVSKPGVAEQWLNVTARSLVATWRNRGFKSPAEAAPWAKAGFDPDGAREWVEAGNTVNQAIEWSAHGVVFATGAACWGRLGVRMPEESGPWVEAGVTSSSDAGMWARLAVNGPDDVRHWLRAGVTDGADAVAWNRAGVHADQAEHHIRSWRRAGVASGKGVASWVLAGVHCAEVPGWLAQGIAGGQELILWRALGVDGSEDLARSAYGRHHRRRDRPGLGQGRGEVSRRPCGVAKGRGLRRQGGRTLGVAAVRGQRRRSGRLEGGRYDDSAASAREARVGARAIQRAGRAVGGPAPAAPAGRRLSTGGIRARPTRGLSDRRRNRSLLLLVLASLPP